MTGININAIIDVIHDAGKIILSAHDIENVTEQKDGTANYVTAYDVAVQNFLYEKLAEIIPGVSFIGEENDDNCSDNKHSELIANGMCCIIDPIDGTTNFITGYRHSAISVGICRFGEIVVGVVYNPYTGELFHAVKGQGAYMNGRKISVAKNKLGNSIVFFGSSPYYRDTLAEYTIDVLKNIFMSCRDVRRSGSAALDLCYLACGRGDVFYEAILSPWDYAASAVIIKEAGGEIFDMCGEEIKFDKKTSVFASNGVCTDEALAIIKNCHLKSFK